ncbi:TPA: hypothetical protein I6205_003530 [Vibrio cholerae]|nr:hypothetical protein [Vibrio cholerae]
MHRKPKQTQHGIAKEYALPYQLHQHNISKEFSKVRDKLGMNADLDVVDRPTYHKERRLSAKLIEALGESATVCMAHSNEKTTKIYTGSNQVVWNEVSAITENLVKSLI